MSARNDLGDAAVLQDAERTAGDNPATRECGPYPTREERDAMLRSLADAHRQIAELHQVVDVIRLQLAGLAH